MKLIFHFVVLLINGVGLWYDYNNVEFPMMKAATKALPWRGRVIYLTMWTIALQTFYFAIAFLNDVIGSNEISPVRKPLIRQLKDLIFSSLAFPLAMFVGATFWGLYAVDRELVFPKILDDYIPTWLNHLLHTNIMIFIFIELVTTFRMYPSRKCGTYVLTGFMLAYVIWLHIVYYKSGFWVYPFLSVMNWPLRIVFYLFSFGLILSFYTLGDKLNKFVWSKQINQIVRSGKKKPH